MSPAVLSLYHYPSCGFCRLVRSELAVLDLDVELRDIHADPAHMRELLDATGRRTVPCLRIDAQGEARWMHESSEIIAFLREHVEATR